MRKTKAIIDKFTHVKSAHKRWKLRNPERYKQSERERKERYVLKDPLRALLKNVKTRAKSKGIEFSISKNDLEIPEKCPVLDIPLQRNAKKGAWPFSPSIDRIDNSKGYIPGNVRIISWRANSVKGDATIEELEAVIGYIKENS